MVSPGLQLCPQRIYGLRVARRGPGSLLVVCQKVYNLGEDEYRKIAISVKLALGGNRLHEIVVYPELSWHQSLFSNYEGRPDVCHHCELGPGHKEGVGTAPMRAKAQKQELTIPWLEPFQFLDLRSPAQP